MSRAKDAYLIDISNCRDKHTSQHSMIVLKQQHPSIYTCVPLSSGLCRHLEVYISKEHDNNDVANNGLIFINDKFRVFLCAALENSAKIVSFKLNPLPLLPKNKVLTGLQKSLAVFGVIMDLGINTESATGVFLWVLVMPCKAFNKVNTCLRIKSFKT